MSKFRQFIKTHKGQTAAVSIIVLVAVAAVITGVVLHIRGKEKNGDQESEGLVEMMADLVNEPVSDQDEPYEGKADEEDKKPDVRIMVNKKRNCITVYKKDKKGKFNTPVKAMVCSVGYNTPLGTYQTSDRYTWKIVNGNVWSQYATRITGNVLFHSVTYQDKNKSTLITKYYNQLGTNASAGCIRVMVSDAKWLMEHCLEGTEVEIYEDEDPGPLGKPASMVLAAGEQWDPSDPDPANPWAGRGAVLQGAVNRTVERNIPFDYLEGLTALDTIGNNVTSLVEVDTDLDIKKPGSYKVKYKLTDGVGKKAEAEVVYTVVDSQPPQFSGIRPRISVSEEGITQEKLLDGVFLADNNELLPKSRITVTVPPQLLEGDNQVTYTAEDDYGNVATAYTMVVVDYEPPQLHLNSDAGHILYGDQTVDEAFALARVYATDSGEELPHDWIRVTIYDAEWGYTFVYSVADRSGQTATLTDTVSYMTYNLTTSGSIIVTALDRTQLLQGVILTNSAGETMALDGVDVEYTLVSGNQYTATYRYQYSSPLGNRTATVTRPFIYGNVTQTPGPSGTPAPSGSPLPAQTAGPSETPSTANPEPTTEPSPTEDEDLTQS